MAEKRYAAYMCADDPNDMWADNELKAYVTARNEEEALKKAKNLPEEAFFCVSNLDAIGYYIPHWNTLWVVED